MKGCVPATEDAGTQSSESKMRRLLCVSTCSRQTPPRLFYCLISELFIGRSVLAETGDCACVILSARAATFQTSGALIMYSCPPMIFHLNEDQETDTETQHTVVSGYEGGRGRGGCMYWVECIKNQEERAALIPPRCSNAALTD